MGFIFFVVLVVGSSNFASFFNFVFYITTLFALVSFFGGFDLVLSSNRLNLLLRRLSCLYYDGGFIQELSGIQLSPDKVEETTITISHYHRSPRPPYRSTTDLHGRSFIWTIKPITQTFLLSLFDLNQTHTHSGTYFLCCDL